MQIILAGIARAASAALAVLLTATAVNGQAGAVWQQHSAAHYVTGPAVHDSNLNVVWHTGPAGGVLQTSLWNGSQWGRLAIPAPPLREGHAMAFDPLRGRLVLFGGRDMARTQVFADTWEFDGVQWQQRTAAGPAGRFLHGMVWHQGRGVVVMAFGSSTPGSYWGAALNDTWEWNGQAWNRRTATGPNPARIASALGYDPLRSELVLCGGHGVVYTPSPVTTSFDETWILGSSGNWTRRSTATPAGAVSGAAMTWDPGRSRLVLIGGCRLNNNAGGDLLAGSSFWFPPADVVKEWNGTDWTATASLSMQPVSAGAAFDAVSGSLLVVGGTHAFQLDDATALRDAAANWVRVGPGAPSGFTAVAWDEARDRLVGLHGYSMTSSRTWEWDGSSWTLAADVPLPLWNSSTAAWHGPTARTAVMTGSSYTADLWLWDGAAWTLAQPATLPPPRRAPALVADPDRGVLVLFGGQGPGPSGSAVALGDTWEWNGVDWRAVACAHAPSPRTASAVAFAADRHAVLLFGGSTGATWLGETWSFDGSDWSQLSVQTSPPNLGNPALVCDEARGRAVLVGTNNGGTSNEQWEFDGATWRQCPTPPSALPLVHDRRRERVVLHAGYATWIYETAHKASAAPYGSGCAASSGVPVLTALARPWLGDQLRLELAALDPTALAAVGLGFQALAVPLPGAPGCTLLADPQALLLLPSGAASRSLALPLPSNPALAGLAVSAQGAVLDASANPLGVALSNGLQLCLGVR